MPPMRTGEQQAPKGPIHYSCPWSDWTNPGYICNYRSNRKTDMKRHYRTIHLHEKPIGCPVPGCDHISAQDEHYKTHYRGKHADPALGPFKCAADGCPRAFMDATQAKRHGKKCEHFSRLSLAKRAATKFWTGKVSDFGPYPKSIEVPGANLDWIQWPEHPGKLVKTGTGRGPRTKKTSVKTPPAPQPEQIEQPVLVQRQTDMNDLAPPVDNSQQPQLEVAGYIHAGSEMEGQIAAFPGFRQAGPVDNGQQYQPQGHGFLADTGEMEGQVAAIPDFGQTGPVDDGQQQQQPFGSSAATGEMEDVPGDFGFPEEAHLWAPDAFQLNWDVAHTGSQFNDPDPNGMFGLDDFAVGE